MLTFQLLGRYGRFANGLFQVASTIGIAVKNGYEYGFPEFINHDHLERFGSKEDINVYTYFENQLPICNIKYPEYFVHWGYHGFNIPDNHSLAGHMQSFKYFDHCRETILHYFTMKDEPEQNDYVAVHWRAGDYQEGENAYHPRQPFEYYDKAMSLFIGEQFILFTDDIPAAAILFAPLMQKYKILYADGKNYIEDFKLMKRCKSFIIANSSFSAMAAWLGTHEEKKVVAPSLWFGKVADISAKDIYHKDWVVI
jgi:hypothetical protein